MDTHELLNQLIGKIYELEERIELMEKAQIDTPTTDDIDDPLLEKARAIVAVAGKASVSLLQRKLKIGYARAARLLDILEEQGIVGPSQGSWPREVLISPDDDGIDEYYLK